MSMQHARIMHAMSLKSVWAGNADPDMTLTLYLLFTADQGHTYVMDMHFQLDDDMPKSKLYIVL